MMTKSFENRNSMQSTRRLSMHPLGLVFSFWVLGVEGIFCFVMFPMCSHQAQSVPRDVPNSTSILSHIVWTQSNFHVYKVYRGAKRNLASFSGREAYIGFYFGECPMLPKKLGMG
jgi:hypothetical protein